MRPLDVTNISIPSEPTSIMACLSPPLTCTRITEFIDGNPLSPDKKIDQIRLNVINGGFFKLHISSSKLTEIIHGETLESIRN